MKYLILAALVVGLITTAGVFAYEFSEHERQVEVHGRQQRLQSQQQLDNAMQAERQQQEQRSLQERKQLDPQAYNPPAPRRVVVRVMLESFRDFTGIEGRVKIQCSYVSQTEPGQRYFERECVPYKMLRENGL